MGPAAFARRVQHAVRWRSIVARNWVREYPIWRYRSSSIAPLFARPASTTPKQWLHLPNLADGDEVCLFLTFAPGGEIPDHSLFNARAWAAAGFRVVVIVAIDDLSSFVSADQLSFASGVILRENQGYDFGGWAATIQELPNLANLARLAIANDSVYGPLDTFDAMLARVRGSSADVVGMTENMEFGRHFQSYMVFFQQRALRSQAFRNFWWNIRNGPRDFVVFQYEINMLRHMTDAGLLGEPLWPAPTERVLDPTLARWRELIHAGFPFVKVRLLRDNPLSADLTDWRTEMTSRGYDLSLIDQHLGARVPA